MSKKVTAKKKTTKRSAKKAVKKVALKRAENLEFNIESDAQAKEICAHLAQLEVTVGWMYLKKMLQDSMAVIQRQIITKKDIDGNEKLTDEEVDTLRMSYLAYEELVNKPAQLIQNLSSGNTPTAPEYDPFARTLKDEGSMYAGVLEDEDE